MSYITPARRIGRIPSVARLGAETMAHRQAGHDVIAAVPATHKYIALGGLKVLTEVAARFYARHIRVALDPETETCILIGPRGTFRRSASAC